MTLPNLGKLGQCLNCRRILISDAYSLCWNCANKIFAMPPQKGMEHLTGETNWDELEGLYREIGGEGG